MTRKEAALALFLVLSIGLNAYTLLQLRDARKTADAAVVQSGLALSAAAAICERVPEVCKQQQL